MTYYGYKRGDDTKIVDWASVSSKLTTDLGEIEKDRADERQKIEGEIAAANDSINEMPVGNYESINNFVLGAANSAAEKLRVQSTLMKNGQLKPSQFASFRQNVMDGIGGYKKVAETYNKTMDELVARQQSRDAGVLEAYEAEFMQNMADLSNTISVIDEKTGMVINAPKLPNGMPDMSRAMPVRDMQNLAHQKYDRFDIDKNLDPIVAKYGKDIQVIKKGGVLTKSDILQRTFGTSKKTMSEVIDDTLLQYNDEQLASVLFDYDQTHKPTQDPAQRDADPEKFILIGKDGRLANRLSPELTDDQKEKARATIKEQLLTKLDLVETPAADTTGTTATERKAAEERNASVRTARTNVSNLRKIFEGKSSTEVNQALSTYNKQFKKVATDADGEFIRAKVSGKGNERKIEVVYRNKFGDLISEKVVDVPEKFQDFVDAAGTTITGDGNLLTLREEAMAEIDDPSVLTRGDEGGKYEVTVVEEQLPSIDTDVTLSDAMDAVESELDWMSYANMGTAYSDMYTAAEDMFKKIGFKDYNITRNGDILTISIPEYGVLDFNMNKSAHGDKHDNRRGAFKTSMQSIYTALTTGKKMGGSGKPAEGGAAGDDILGS